MDPERAKKLLTAQLAELDELEQRVRRDQGQPLQFAPREEEFQKLYADYKPLAVPHAAGAGDTRPQLLLAK